VCLPTAFFKAVIGNSIVSMGITTSDSKNIIALLIKNALN
jgi:hypothetical protein